VKFLVDAHHLGRRQTGNETWTRNVIAALQPLVDHREVDYAVSLAGVDELRRLTPSAAHVVSGRSSVRLLAQLPRIARAIDADAVLVTYTVPATTRPCVVMVHDLSFLDPAATQWMAVRTRLRFRVTNRVSCRVASRILTPSEYTKRELVEKLPVLPERVSVATDAVDPELLGLLSATPRRSPERFTVLAVGEVVPRKNLLLVATAVRRCLDAGVDMCLRIVGSVPAAGRETAARIRALLGSAASFTGYVPLAGLAIEYRSADVVCVASSFEGFGIPVVEAMAAATPVVVSDATCLPEIAGDAALVVPDHDVAAWSGALLRLTGDADLRDRLGRLGPERAGHFSWEESGRAALSALKAAAAARR
jgi:glycosyltransferase involved in cell wall biosynthesis